MELWGFLVQHTEGNEAAELENAHYFNLTIEN